MDLHATAPSSYQAYFRDNCLRAPGTSEIDDDAALAIHLITFLGNNHERHDGCWPDRDVRRVMRNTCHALEALHLLNLPAHTQDYLAGGVAWLVNLSTSDSPDGDEQEFESPRWHPSRFKTLTWLSSFDNAVVRADFHRLAQNVDRNGYLRNVHNRHLLATLIYLDTLFFLGQMQTLPEFWQQCQGRALGAISREVASWFENPSTAEPFVSTQELSYALDILLTYGALTPQDPMIETIRSSLVAELDTSDENKILSEEALYCSIQLSRHFSQHRDTQRILRHLRSALLRGYQAGSLAIAAQEFPFHPLVLRLLTTYHDTRFSGAILKQLFRTHEEQFRSEVQARQAEVETELRQLLQQYQVLVDIKGVQKLGGGMRAEKVYSVEFEVALSAPGGSDGPGERQNTTPLWSDSQKLVVKTAPIEDLRRSINRYKSLPFGIRPLFAAHAHDPYIIQTTHGPAGYLIMQDLLHMQTLDALLDELDLPMLTQRQGQVLTSAVSRVAGVLHRIHQEDVTRRDHYAGGQIARLYLAPLEDKIIHLGQKFPRLKPELRGIWFNESDYKSLNHYLGILQNRIGQLRPSALCLVHGDCHTRNIMLDRTGDRVMFIDLDRVSWSGDYIDDFALLLEDACVYRYLSGGERGGAAGASGGGGLRPTDVVEVAMPDGAVGWRCTRSLFHKPLTQRFQTALLELLPGYAQTMHNDANWQARLWLATAVRLLGLASLVEELSFAVVLYAEAIRLLDTLCECLTKNTALPALLFGAPGQAADTNLRKRQASLIAALQQVFPDLAIHPRGHRLELRSGDGQLCAVLITADHDWRLALAAAPQAFEAVAPAVQPFQSGRLQAVVALPADPDQAFNLASACLHVVLG